jgi:hypothetical protein
MTIPIPLLILPHNLLLYSCTFHLFIFIFHALKWILLCPFITHVLTIISLMSSIFLTVFTLHVSWHVLYPVEGSMEFEINTKYQIPSDLVKCLCFKSSGHWDINYLQKRLTPFRALIWEELWLHKQKIWREHKIQYYVYFYASFLIFFLPSSKPKGILVVEMNPKNI